MSEDTLAQTIRAAMKAAMKAKDKDRLSTIRLILAEFKRIEVDERIEVGDIAHVGRVCQGAAASIFNLCHHVLADRKFAAGHYNPGAL